MTTTDDAKPGRVRAVARGIQQFGSPWRLVVIAYLRERPLRFNEVLRMGEDGGLNARTLSRTLRLLVEQNIVHREVIGTQPVAVLYSLTSKGERLGRLLDAFGELAADRDLDDVQL